MLLLRKIFGIFSFLNWFKSNFFHYFRENFHNIKAFSHNKIQVKNICKNSQTKV